MFDATHTLKSKVTGSVPSMFVFPLSEIDEATIEKAVENGEPRERAVAEKQRDNYQLALIRHADLPAGEPVEVTMTEHGIVVKSENGVYKMTTMDNLAPIHFS